ncbi:MAG: NAD(P)H-dependent glycerol-3-phosphate dehydrogenase [Pseudorhodobacter sp.]
MIGIAGAGAFGGALAVALARQGEVKLWGRGIKTRVLPRLPGVELPQNISVTTEIDELSGCETVLLALPTQALAGFLAGAGARLDAPHLVACCKGVDLASGLGPTGVIAAARPGTTPAILTGPSFAADIARGLPTALTLACRDETAGQTLQVQLSTPVLRLYRSTDALGAELGGALKNVIAIAAGITIGAQLGDSARAALMTRGFAEMQRLALALGARAETLSGLSGFGDLVLTCTSAQSRNFRYGQALGAGESFDSDTTVEGVATAQAVLRLARKKDIAMPIATMVAALSTGRITLPEAVDMLMSRPLKQE